VSGNEQEAAVARLILAAPINPDNTPHGYNWTFAFPMLLFIVIALVLYVLFSRPHRRVPARALTLPVGGRASAAGGPAAAPAGAETGQADEADEGGEPGEPGEAAAAAGEDSE
jgi:hypothetical protein